MLIYPGTEYFGTNCSMLCSFSSPTLINEPALLVPCLGAYGGPVNPNIALGGFDGTAYENASTLIITFVVNNHQNKSKVTKAMAWEKAFLDYMKEYVKNSSNKNLTISFSAERAIQDELNRESNTDIITIFVSYMIMFLYITVALGQFKSFSRILVSKEFFAKDCLMDHAHPRSIHCSFMYFFQNLLLDSANLFPPLFDFKINPCSGLAKFVYIVCTMYRAVTKGRGPGIFPGYYKSESRLL